MCENQNRKTPSNHFGMIFQHWIICNVVESREVDCKKVVCVCLQSNIGFLAQRGAISRWWWCWLHRSGRRSSTWPQLHSWHAISSFNAYKESTDYIKAIRTFLQTNLHTKSTSLKNCVIDLNSLKSLTKWIKLKTT